MALGRHGQGALNKELAKGFKSVAVPTNQGATLQTKEEKGMIDKDAARRSGGGKDISEPEDAEVTDDPATDPTHPGDVPKNPGKPKLGGAGPEAPMPSGG